MRDDSVRSIQTRLIVLLVRAFLAVVLLTLAIVFGVTTYFLSAPTRFNPPERIPIVSRLETFYLARGSWDGVNLIVRFDESHEWENATLVGLDGMILIDRGQLNTPLVGTHYTPVEGSRVVPMMVNHRLIGTLVLNDTFVPRQVNSVLNLLFPVVLISIFLAVLTIVIGILLVRRIVNPLAQVVAAAGAVAGGDLSTRVSVSGPDDLRALSDSFNHMAATLERDANERRDMLADIAHELRTPLTIMRGRLEGIVDGIYPANADHITPALEETYLLERLVEDLRLLTLAEARQLHFEKSDVNLNDLARHVIDMFQAEAEEKQISLSAQLPDADVVITADHQRTEQVVGNLVANALRYTPGGGKVWITVETVGAGSSRLAGASRPEKGSVVLSVSDNGPGVPAEDLSRIFNRFWREEKSRSRASGGAGLGLAIARQLVEAQGGQISASNLPGGGLQVKCEFLAV
jgi:two-component system OmpR family sensor kinase/two-component system sensor histidine kinase BaeS